MVVDHAATILVGMAYFLVVFGMQIVSDTDVPYEAEPSTIELAGFELMGSLFVILGGYVAARMAGVRHVAHGTAVGVGALLIGTALIMSPGDDFPMWYDAFSLAVVVPAGAAGGYLALVRADRNRQSNQ